MIATGKHRVVRVLILALSGAVVTSPLRAAPETIRLWADSAPGAKGDEEKDIPTLTAYLPEADKATGVGVVICPGGGYGGLSIEPEGHEVAKWLRSAGITGFIVQYRCRRAGYGHPAPLLDAQRSIRTVRTNAEQWRVDPKRIGVMGFSAGGHLASTTGTHFDPGDEDANDPIDRQSSRPDFMVLVYPVISFTEPFTHVGSRVNLLGKDADAELIEKFSSEKQVTPKTPPTFLVHGTNDHVVPVENSIAMYAALRKANVPAEMHIYTDGPHGFGVGNRLGATVESWRTLCEEWIERVTGESYRDK